MDLLKSMNVAQQRYLHTAGCAVMMALKKKLRITPDSRSLLQEARGTLTNTTRSLKRTASSSGAGSNAASHD